MKRMLVIAAAFAALMSSPALAQGYGPPPSSSVYGTPYQAVPQEHAVPQGRAAQRARPYSAYGAVTPFGSPGAAGGGTNGMSAAREKAMRDCMVEARRYSQTTWGSMDSHQYRTCMAQRGQME